MKRIILLPFNGKYYIQRRGLTRQQGKCKRCVFNRLGADCYIIPCITREDSYYYIKNTFINRIRTYLNL